MDHVLREGRAPGIFSGVGRALVPISTARRGQSVLLYVTGEGDTTPILDTGAPPSNGTPIDGSPRPCGAAMLGGVAVAPFFYGDPVWSGGCHPGQLHRPRERAVGDSARDCYGRGCRE